MSQSVAVFAAAPEAIQVRGETEEHEDRTSAYSLFFDPQVNDFKLDKQKIDYDVTKQTTLRLGPYLLDETSVAMQVTREQGEFYELDFGFDVSRKVGPIYILSFRWPADYISKGVIEIISDRSESLWRRRIRDEELNQWTQTLDGQKNKKLFERQRDDYEEELEALKSQKDIAQIQKRLNLARPQQLSVVHQKSNWGLAHKGFFEFPLAQLTEPFRFCVSEDGKESRLALCSRRYQFVRRAGRYQLVDVKKETRPRVLINDKPVTDKGTAIFLDNNIAIKLAAVLKSGTYFEFVSHPKEISVVDIVKSTDNKNISLIGFGDSPMGQIDESFYADTVHQGFLNFMPTIGDLRKYWRASTSYQSPYVYLKGEGGAPFRQSFLFSDLPSTDARITLSEETTRSTYTETTWVEGKVNPQIKLSAEGTEVKRTSPTTFRWNFPAPEKGVYNKGILNVHENDKKFRASYDIYRGYSNEVSLRLTGVVANSLQLILFGEVAAQHWFEEILGSENYTLSRQRWGMSAKHFQSIFATANKDSTGAYTFSFAVTNLDLKYRLSPGIWGRDPTVGLIFANQMMQYRETGYLPDDTGEQAFTEIHTTASLGGGGVFWARSMPKIFDDLFNILPIFRYPKWVDWEFLYYPLSYDGAQSPRVNAAMNFHGKVQWTPRFFGEGAFGIKSFSYNDSNLDSRFQDFVYYFAYGTVGLGYNF